MNNFLTQSINSRPLTTFSSIHHELQLAPEKNYLFDLSYLSALSITGERAIEFLQGQFTADITQVNDIRIVQTAQCNLKGRILALMDVINWQGIQLILPKDMLIPTQQSLTKTALLSKVSIEENTHWRFFGFYCQQKRDLIPGSVFLPDTLYAKAESKHFCYYHLGHGFYIFIVHEQVVEALTHPFIEQQQLLGSLTWHTLRLFNHQMSIYPESRGLFLPHRLNLHQTPYLSFEKGCYKGQEIIARTHYRATLKHELQFYTLCTNTPLFSGQKLYQPDTEIESGEIIDYSILDTNRYLVAVSLLKESPLELSLEKSTVVTLLTPCL
ncbi:MAG: folate-binding protein YgfZ [Legionella sp.]|nr:MAG: folate-binding protein YgfZ [Legionella sp.]PJD98926.1 MAG: folate-binding protein YgfZ [Legionella sp.]